MYSTELDGPPDADANAAADADAEGPWHPLTHL